MSGPHDWEETPEATQRALDRMRCARSDYRELKGWLADPLPGSMLDVEHEHTVIQPVHTLVLAHRGRARDNLEQLFEMTFDDDSGQVRARPFAPYSLLRVAVEAAATALWLVKSDRKADRVFRALQLAYWNEQETLKFMEVFKGKEDAALTRETTEKTTARLKELKDTVVPLRQEDLGSRPTSTAILTAVSVKSGGDGPGYGPASPLVVWKMSSAFLHGAQKVMGMVSNTKQVGEDNRGVAWFEITPDLRLIAIAISTCVDLPKRIDERYVFLATHDYGGRFVGD